MIVIMNPPYGKNCSFSKKVLHISFEAYKEVICLAPIKTNFELWDSLKNVVGPISFYTVWNIHRPNDLKLYISHCKEGFKYPYTKEEILLTKIQHDWYKAVQVYNATHTVQHKYIQNFNIKHKEKYVDWDESLIFEIPIYTPANGIGLQGETGEHNLCGKPIQWREGNLTGPFGIYFNTKQEFDNFSHWYYTHPYSWVATTGCIEYLMDVTLSTLYTLYGTSPSILKYKEVWPNLDWTRPWADEEIIQELKDKAGLPQDWKVS